ncbi:SCO6745 family protein [Nocardioides sp. Kera G14]|uniref:SCO6745 family protein n=1 Tax=Nocardioides sp. Kera G14 TaxID=2884264 RepID=UPI001D10A64F|nr:hypothetical protein [Nocardioides sp. Kera G14]UDY23020.1 hypothetical protein LH076_13240 [Nocardioides sp. Kera G14]
MTEPATARRMWALLEPIHVVCYFAPEALSALKEVGYKGYWMGYFAQRSAPLGAASAEVVQALFYNFAPEHVAKALPDAWSFAPPEVALTARLQGSTAALARHAAELTGGPVPDLERAAELALRAALAAPLEGRALFAAHRSVPVPDDVLGRLWHAATLLREHRGDGHVAALLAHGIEGRESHVFHAAQIGLPAKAYERTRNFTPEEWAACQAALTGRGLLDDDGSLSTRGAEVKAEIEDATDSLAASAYDVLSEAEIEELVEQVHPLRAAIVASGELPNPTPTGLDLNAF